MDRNAFFDVWTPRVLSVLRILAGAMIVQHGAQKLFGFPIPADHPVAAMSQAWVGGILEFFVGLLVLFGLATRLAAFLLSGTMAVAYFQFHAPGGFWPLVNKGDLAVLMCFVYLYLAFAGGGPWSLDALLGKRKAVVA